jgi:drug/metabolite transporter (DMT)-like permease
MSRHHHIPSWAFKLLLLSSAAMWGLGNVVLKGIVGYFDPSWLSGIRFLLAAVLLALLFWPHVRDNLTADHVVVGLLVGVVLFLSYYLNGVGLHTTEASKGSFLISTYTVMVPFVAWALMHNRPSVCDVVAALLCVCGVAVMSLKVGEGVSLGLGDLLILLAAFASALQMTLVARFARGRDMLALTIWQFVSAGVCGLLVGAAGAPFPDLASFGVGEWASFLYLVVFASFLAVVFQNVGLSHVPTAQGSLLLSCECIFGVSCAVAFLGDVITPQMAMGFVLVICGIVVSEGVPALLRRRRLRSVGIVEVE